MADYTPPVVDIKFLLFEVFKVEQLWESLEGIEELDRDTANHILDEAGKICSEVIFPLNREGDEEGCHWQDGEVTTPKGYREAYQQYIEGGWNALGGHPDFGGMGMPKTLVSAIEEMVQGASISFGLAPMLTAGACLALQAHASDELRSQYLEKMYSGEWSGTMDLTEPHCGTDLGLIRTKAEPQDDGSYLLNGTKIFITWGEHDMSSNIIHMVLAKLPGAPSGSKGISLFLVPKFIPGDNGEPGERNAMRCGSIEKKMGIKGSATCVMNFDGAKGWLVGEANKGLAYMFTMMNYERLSVGIQGMGTAELSYQNAVAYAKDRLQSRSPTGAKNTDAVADPIIVHPDVRRMLLDMKVLNEAGRAFYVYVSTWMDRSKFGSDARDKKRSESMLAWLTPIAKAFMSDIALESAIQGQQVFGGHGYIREWGQEQYVRDIRITQIYEGTNGIQAMDLIGRKTVACQAELLSEFVKDVNDFLNACDLDDMGYDFKGRLTECVHTLQKQTDAVLALSKSDPNVPGAVAVDYLHLCGYAVYAYMWLRILHAVSDRDKNCDFKALKIRSARYYFDKHLPKLDYLAQKVDSGCSELMNFRDDEF